MEKNKFLYRSFQIIFVKKMDSDNYEDIYCVIDDEYGLFS